MLHNRNQSQQQHLYCTKNTIQAMYLFIQKQFLRVLVSSCGMMTEKFLNNYQATFSVKIVVKIQQLLVLNLKSSCQWKKEWNQMLTQLSSLTSDYYKAFSFQIPSPVSVANPHIHTIPSAMLALADSNPPCTTLFIANLGHNTTEEELRNLFQR